ncbi:hypothetical protein FBU30_005939 [Linnemannia zychae]|nr:hypothetical protein FBU30_005939 [Linnemannia zychae]
MQHATITEWAHSNHLAYNSFLAEDINRFLYTSTSTPIINGQLISTFPAAYACHNPHYDDAACQKIRDGYYHDSWRQTQPGAVQQTNWEISGDQGCLGLNRSMPCYQGAVPLYTVNATTIEHVQEAVKFAGKYNIRLTIKNTGHDYLGRSTGASSLNLWVYYNKSVTFSDSFVPEGADESTEGIGAVILGPGVIWDDVYKAADDHGVVVVGGAEPTVGASGGYCLGGGHSPLSRQYGLCADNVLQYKVVTADGSVKIANAFQNKDLFWALRGGGGGTFAVVVEAVFRTHPPLDSIQVAIYQVYLKGRDIRRKIINNWFSQQINLSVDGWSGYSFVQDDFLKIAFFLPNKDWIFARNSISPFIDYAESLDGVLVIGLIDTFSSFWSAYEASKSALEDKNAGMNIILGSRLIPRQNIENSDRTEELADALIKAQDASRGYWNPNAYFLTQHVAGGAVANFSNNETSVHPAWRDALMNVIFISRWDDDLPVEEQQMVARLLTSTIQILRDITPGSGAYFNEADPGEPDWQRNYFGSNYPRLKSVKDLVDPTGLFLCNKCVGSEDWIDDLICPSLQQGYSEQ